jgi:hypothetical protein
METKEIPIEIRIWRHVDKTPTCWVWTASVDKMGYPAVKQERSGRSFRPHRVIYEIHNGPITSKARIAHKCSNKRCVNPEHLFRKHASSTEERFWKFVKKTDSCWLWIGGTGNKGYGRMTLTSNVNGKVSQHSKGASRISYELRFGSFDSSLYVCHKCDNPLCVNPDHLFLGTQKDNIIDMIKKGREAPSSSKRRQGEKNGGSFLKEHQVLELRKMHASKNYSSKELMKKFKIKKSMYSNIVGRKSWTHI